MRPVEYVPDSILTGLVKCFWTTQRCFVPPSDTFQILPDRYVELIFSTGVDCFLLTKNNALKMPAIYLVNLLSEPFTIQAQGTLTIVAARLYAWSLTDLLGEIPLAVNKPVVSLDGSFVHVIPELKKYLEQGQYLEAVNCLQVALIDRFKQRIPIQQRMALFLRQVWNQPELPSISELSSQFALSSRQVQRILKAASGTTPKMLLRLSRFEQARDRLWQSPDSDLTSLAYELGYADQAHFSRDFKAFSQTTPRQFATQMRLRQTEKD